MSASISTVSLWRGEARAYFKPPLVYVSWTPESYSLLPTSHVPLIRQGNPVLPKADKLLPQFQHGLHYQRAEMAAMEGGLLLGSP
jgi:hypothetical protein